MGELTLDELRAKSKVGLIGMIDALRAELEQAQRQVEELKGWHQDMAKLLEQARRELSALREQARNCPPHDWTDWTDKENLADGFPVCKKCGVKWGHSDNSQDDVINFFRELEDLPPAPEEKE